MTYRDNDTPADKRECDRKILAELNALVFAKQVDDIWTADLVDMSSFSRSNKCYKYLLTVIDILSKYGWVVPLKT